MASKVLFDSLYFLFPLKKTAREGLTMDIDLHLNQRTEFDVGAIRQRQSQKESRQTLRIWALKK